jgi:hypothetical protein
VPDPLDLIAILLDQPNVSRDAIDSDLRVVQLVTLGPIAYIAWTSAVAQRLLLHSAAEESSSDTLALGAKQLLRPFR